nr:uncharacterized protein LOC124817340 [Hydra vulgaris]
MEIGNTNIVLCKPFDFSKIKETILTRNQQFCQCDICLTAMCNLTRGSNTEIRGRPKLNMKVLPSPGPVKVFKRCLNVIGPGLAHTSCIKKRRENLMKQLDKDDRGAELQCSKTLKQKFEKQGNLIKVATCRTSISIQKLNTSSKALFTDSPIHTSEVNKLKNACGVSNTQDAKVLSIFRSWKGRKSFEKNTRNKLIEEDAILNEYLT